MLAILLQVLATEIIFIDFDHTLTVVCVIPSLHKLLGGNCHGSWCGLGILNCFVFFHSSKFIAGGTS